MNKVIISKQWALGLRDLLKGGVIAVISPVFTILIQSLSAESLTINWKSILNVAIISFLTYMSKNFVEPSRVIVPVKADKVAEVAETIKKEL